MFQQEGSAGINDLLTNETYQKDTAMLQLLNTRIKEMLGEDIKTLRDKMVELSEAKKGVRDVKHTKKSKGTADKDYDGDGKVETPKDEVWGSRAKAAAKAGKPFSEAAKGKCCCASKGEDKCPVHGKVDEGMADKLAGAQAQKIAGRKKQTEPGKTSGVKGKWPGSDKKASTKEKDTDDSPKGGEAPTSLWGDPRAAEVAKKAKGTPVAGKAQSAKQPKDDVDEGKDEGKPGKGFAKIVKKATPKYGKETAEKIAGAQREKMKKAGKLEETNARFKRNVRIVNESLAYLIQEDEEGKAKAITAAGDIVNDFTSWMQRVGQYQTKSMIELADSIRADFGATESETFKQTVGPALAATLETLTAQREAISNAVAVLAGEQMPAGEPMGAEPAAAPMEPGMDMAAPDEMNPPAAGDEFAASDAAAGAGTPGREMRESRFSRKLAESHSIISKLAK